MLCVLDTCYTAFFKLMVTCAARQKDAFFCKHQCTCQFGAGLSVKISSDARMGSSLWLPCAGVRFVCSGVE